MPRDALPRKIWQDACAATVRCATATPRAVPGAGARTAALSPRGPGTATSSKRRSPRPIRPDAGYLAFVRDCDPLGAWAYWRQEMGGGPIGGKIWKLVSEGAVDPFDALLKGAGTEHEAAASLTVVAEAVR